MIATVRPTMAASVHLVRARAATTVRPAPQGSASVRPEPSPATPREPVTKPCLGAVTPAVETCGDGLDNDCDGVVDEGCVCAPGSSVHRATRDRWGPPVWAPAKPGIQTCNASGTAYGTCTGDVTPTGRHVRRWSRQRLRRYGGRRLRVLAGLRGIVLHRTGGYRGDRRLPSRSQDVQCDGNGVRSVRRLHHAGRRDPAAMHSTTTAMGTTDDGCVCTPGTTAACYAGPPSTEDVGSCLSGTQTCNESGTGYGACVGAVLPVDEVCADGIDNDCDGVSDDGCVCFPQSVAPCYGGPAGTAGVGVCQAGQQTCNATGHRVRRVHRRRGALRRGVR
jgi:hypothetical protein